MKVEDKLSSYVEGDVILICLIVIEKRLWSCWLGRVIMKAELYKSPFFVR